jgi:hypothetical protein
MIVDFGSIWARLDALEAKVFPQPEPEPEPTPEPIPEPTPDPFDELAKAPNVVRALKGSEPSFTSNDPRIYNLPEGSMAGSVTRPVYDAAVGALRFDLPPVPQGTTAPNIAGSFYFNFPHFGPNQKFRVRWQQMWNAAFLRTKFLNYTANKQVIIGSGDGPGIPPQTSCTAPDVVVTSYANFRFSHLYHGCGRYLGLYGSGLSFQNQHPGCDYNATTAQANAGDKVTPPAACAGWPEMQFQDYALEIENGPIDGAQYVYSVVKLYIGLNPDGSLHLAHLWDSREINDPAFNGKGLFVGTEATGERFFGKFWGTPYMTGYLGGHTETLQTWYRNFLVQDLTSEMVQPLPEPTIPPLEIAPNAAINLGLYVWTKDGGHESGAAITDYSGLVRDKKRRRFVILGGGHTSTDYDSVNSFVDASRSWKELYPPTPGTLMTPDNYDTVRGAWLAGPAGPYPRPAARHTLDEMMIIGDELVIMARVEGNYITAGRNWPGGYTSLNTTTPARIAAMNLDTLVWRFSQDDSGVGDYPACEYDPLSGKGITLGVQGLFIYDPETMKNTKVIDLLSFPGASQIVDENGVRIGAGGLGYNENLVYFPPNQKHYYFNSSTGYVFELDLDRTDFTKSMIRRVGTAPKLGTVRTKYAYDSKNQVIGGGICNNVFNAFNPMDRTWVQETINGLPGTIAFMCMDYSEEDNAYVMLNTRNPRETWAYRWK